VFCDGNEGQINLMIRRSENATASVKTSKSSPTAAEHGDDSISDGSSKVDCES
jgi:hypothetical protein